MINPVKALLAFRRVSKDLDEIEKESKTMSIRDLLLSKRFWVAVAGLLIDFSGVLPPHTAAILVLIGNSITKFWDVFNAS